jgi:DNA-binding transcriptional LysR family regulator
LPGPSKGLGLVLQPTFIAGELISRGEFVLGDYQWPVTPAYAIYPPTRHLSYRVREFIDFLADRFAGVPYWDRDCC